MNKKEITLWGRAFELTVVYDCYPGETILDSQREALHQLSSSQIIESSLDEVKAYVKDTAAGQAELPIENIFKYVMPKCIFVPHNQKAALAAILCNYKFDAEHGIAVVFENGKCKEVGPEDIIL